MRGKLTASRCKTLVKVRGREKVGRRKRRRERVPACVFVSASAVHRHTQALKHLSIIWDGKTRAVAKEPAATKSRAGEEKGNKYCSSRRGGSDITLSSHWQALLVRGFINLCHNLTTLMSRTPCPPPPHPAATLASNQRVTRPRIRLRTPRRGRLSVSSFDASIARFTPFCRTCYRLLGSKTAASRAPDHPHASVSSYVASSSCPPRVEGEKTRIGNLISCRVTFFHFSPHTHTDSHTQRRSLSRDFVV